MVECDVNRMIVPALFCDQKLQMEDMTNFTAAIHGNDLC